MVMIKSLDVARCRFHVASLSSRSLGPRPGSGEAVGLRCTRGHQYRTRRGRETPLRHTPLLHSQASDTCGARSELMDSSNSFKALARRASYSSVVKKTQRLLPSLVSAQTKLLKAWSSRIFLDFCLEGPTIFGLLSGGADDFHAAYRSKVLGGLDFIARKLQCSTTNTRKKCWNRPKKLRHMGFSAIRSSVLGHRSSGLGTRCAGNGIPSLPHLPSEKRHTMCSQRSRQPPCMNAFMNPFMTLHSQQPVATDVSREPRAPAQAMQVEQAREWKQSQR